LPDAEAAGTAAWWFFNAAGVIARRRGDFDAARELYERSLMLIGGPDKVDGGVAGMLNNLGAVSLAMGDYATARTYLEGSLSVTSRISETQDSGKPLLTALAMQNLADCCLLQGDPDRCVHLLEETLALWRGIGWPNVFGGLELLAEAHCDTGDTVAARSCLHEAVEVCRRTGDQACLNSLGRLAHLCGNPEKAVQLLATWAALRPADAAPPDSGWKERYTALERELRAALSGDAYARAEAIGRTMTWEQAVNYALDDGG
jgi:tetratricopeptide (TPR) repeat protein